MAKASTLVVRGVLVGQNIASDIRIGDGHVVSIEAAGSASPDLGGEASIIGPPLFDIQVNGAFGIDLQGQDVRPSDVRALCERLAACGVSHWIPTLITASYDDMAHGCRVLAEAMEDPVVARAVPGIHLEGPYISPADGPRGAHPKAHVRPPNIAEFRRWFDAARGKVAYTTVAPEVDGACAFIRAVTGLGVVVSLGHHDASADAIDAAVEAGARMCTHLGNGLASTIHRHHNPIWPQLAEERLIPSLIADLEHLPGPMLKSMVRATGPSRFILASDCVHMAGLPPGKYSLGGHEVELTPTGRICLSGTDLLAGSALMLLQGLVNAWRAAGVTLEQAYAGATTTPAALFGLSNSFGLPHLDAPANFIVFEVDRGTSDWRARLQAAYIAGTSIEVRKT